jgi:alanine racemase
MDRPVVKGLVECYTPRVHSQSPIPNLSRPTWAEIDLGATAYNVKRIKEIVGPRVDVMAVVKAEAYGHGALEVARTALQSGASWLGVAALNEAIPLRQAGISAPIGVLGWTPGWLAQQAIEHDIACAVFDIDTAGAFGRAAQAIGRPARLHVKLNTGMNRLGLPPDEAADAIERMSALQGVSIEGVFTHFARADEADPAYTQQQIARFKQVLSEVEARGVAIPIRHAANSPGVLRFPESHFDMVRLGIAMHGLDPSDDVPLPGDFRPVLALKTLVAQVQTLPPGSPVSYGGSYVTRGYERIAVLPIGYADGFRRKPANWGEVLVRGLRAPIVGRVCMDQCMIDVTHIPGVAQGDEVVLIGAQGEDRIRAEEVAARLGTNNYEVASMIMGRVPRVSVRDQGVRAKDVSRPSTARRAS